MSAVSVDLAICTWNRAGLLRQTLESVTRLAVPRDIAWRVLVVDNASTDGTAETLDGFSTRLPLVRLLEPQQGHTFARNRAVLASQADWVLWTDDDVLVDPGWLTAMMDAARRWPAAAFLGGPIEPVFVDGQPEWIAENWETLRGCYAWRDLGAEEHPLDDRQLPYGANFAVRGDIQREHRFATELGRRGSAVLGEDELDLMRRLLDKGLTGRWVPDARVQHCIPADRATPEYVRDYFVGQGRALVAKGKAWSGSRIRLRWTALWHRLMYQLARGIAPSPLWLGHLARSGLARGQYLELGHSHKVRRPGASQPAS